MSFFLVIVIMGIIVSLLGIFLIPAKSSATKEIIFDASIDEVWRVYTEPERQAEWRRDVGEVVMSEDGQSWTERLNQGGFVIHFEIIEASSPHRYILKTGAPNNFEGRYSAEFREQDTHTIGTFTEEAKALGLVPKVLRFLFVRQTKLIEEYAEDAKLEILRRRSLPQQ